MKLNWHFRWGVWRKGFAPNGSLCYDMGPCYFTDVDRDLNVSCICHILIFYRGGLSALSPIPNLEGQVIKICLAPTFQPTRSTRLVILLSVYIMSFLIIRHRKVEMKAKLKQIPRYSPAILDIFMF